MANPKKVTEIATIDVNMVILDTGTDQYALDTASKIAVEPQIETTDAVKLVIKGVLKAQKPEKSTITGNKITLTDNVFAPEEVKILQGGTIVHAKNYTHSVTTTTASGAHYITAGTEYISFDLPESLSSGDTVVYCDNGSLVVTKDGASKSLSFTVSTETPSSGTSLTTTTEEDDKIRSYTPPTVGSGEKGQIFRLHVYSAQYNAAGQIVQYEKITYPNCQGVPVAFASEDGVFRVSEYTINSFPDTNQPPYYLEYVAALPDLVED